MCKIIYKFRPQINFLPIKFWRQFYFVRIFLVFYDGTKIAEMEPAQIKCHAVGTFLPGELIPQIKNLPLAQFRYPLLGWR